MQETKLQKVTEILKEQGCSDEQIAQFLTDLTKTSFGKLYSEAVTLFTEDDLKLIESCQDEQSANNIIRQKYTERVGADPDEVVKKYIDDFCTGFLNEYEKDKQNHLGTQTQ